MKRELIFSLCMLGGGAAFAADKDTTTAKTAAMKLPSDVRLVATSEVTEVRSFPELNKNKEATGTEDTIGAGALDNVYESPRTYREVVRFYDAMIKSGDAKQLSRSTTKTSTAWELRLTGGGRENVIVRNTRPTTIETLQGATASESETIKNDLGKDSPSLYDSDK